MMKKLLLIAVVFYVFIASSCSKENVGNGYKVEYENSVETEQELMILLNEHRVSLGFSSLTHSEVVYEYANDHTDYMIGLGDINHHNFEARASSIILETEASNVSENVAKDYDTATEAFQAWLDSPSHKETMEGNFTHTAVSVKIDKDSNFYFTQMFYQ